MPFLTVFSCVSMHLRLSSLMPMLGILFATVPAGLLRVVHACLMTKGDWLRSMSVARGGRRKGTDDTVTCFSVFYGQAFKRDVSIHCPSFLAMPSPVPCSLASLPISSLKLLISFLNES